MQTLQMNTPLGPMIAAADDFGLYVLDFIDNPDLPKVMARLEERTEGSNDILSLVQKELQAYFEGTLTTFTLPLAPQGTEFQKRTWMALTRVPYGVTQSYADIAAALNQPTAFRAVANANGVNPIAIIIPCHRVIKSCGNLCGYRGGTDRKRWLLKHESENTLAQAR